MYAVLYTITVCILFHTMSPFFCHMITMYTIIIGKLSKLSNYDSDSGFQEILFGHSHSKRSGDNDDNVGDNDDEYPLLMMVMW